MISKERRRRNIAEARLLVEKDARHPFVSYGDMLPFTVFVVAFVSPFVSQVLPVWVAMVVFPSLLFAAFWIGTRRAKYEFEDRLDQVADELGE